MHALGLASRVYGMSLLPHSTTATTAAARPPPWKAQHVTACTATTSASRHGWRRSDPWMTSIVDLDPAHPAGSSGSPRAARGHAWRPGWPYRARSSATASGWWRSTRPPRTHRESAGRCHRPGSSWTTFHLVMLGNKMLTDVRQRVQHEQQGTVGRSTRPGAPPAAAGRQRARPQSPGPVEDRLQHGSSDLTGQRDPCRLGRQGAPASDVAGPRPDRVQQTRDLDSPDRVPGGLRGRGYARGARLARTIEKWWPEIEGFLELGNTNARTEGYNRVFKQIKRVACGFLTRTTTRCASCCTAQPTGPRELPAVEVNPAQMRRARERAHVADGPPIRGIWTPDRRAVLGVWTVAVVSLACC